MTKHIIYGLYAPDDPRNILYVGSTKLARKERRLMEHRNGESARTAKGAEKDNVELSTLEMRVLRHWTSGEEDCPEHEIMQQQKDKGMARWNWPHALTSLDARRGIKTQKENGWPGQRKGRETMKENGWKSQRESGPKARRKARQRTIEIGKATNWEAQRKAGRKSVEANKKNGFANLEKGLEVQRAGGWEGQRKGAHIRWHVNRGISKPDECEFCARRWRGDTEEIEDE